MACVNCQQHLEIFSEMSSNMRKPAFCIYAKTKVQISCTVTAAEQHLCFRYIASTFPLLLKSEILSPWPSFVVAQLGLCRTWSETLKTGFLATRLKYKQYIFFQASLIFQKKISRCC